MTWLAEVIQGLEEPSALRKVEEALESALSKAGDLESLKDLLGAGSVLLHAGAAQGELILPPLGRAFEAVQNWRGPDAGTAVVGLGDLGRTTLLALCARREAGSFPRAIYVDMETSRVRELGQEIAQVILSDPGQSGAISDLCYSDYIRSVYRASAGSNRPPALLADNLAVPPGGRLTVHVVVGIEDSWMLALPDILLDLRSFLDREARGMTVVHLLMRPSPRISTSTRAVLRELEQSKPFDEAFLVCSDAAFLERRAVELILLSARVPDILLHHVEQKRDGAFASYGVAPAPQVGEGRQEEASSLLNRFEDAFTAALPSWMPKNTLLLELATEHSFYIYPPESPPPEAVWRLCQGLIPLPLPGHKPTLCRIQRGLRLSDLRLGGS